MKKLIVWLIGLMWGAVSLTGCSEDRPTFSLLPESDVFYQAGGVNDKMDILFVIDNSGSMQDLQNNMANNFSAFIGDFQTKGYDFHISVTTTEAYKAIFTGNNSYARFKDGGTGIRVLTPLTPNLSSVFTSVVQVGIYGSGDERAFQSFKEALTNSVNDSYGFRRAEAYLAIVIVSDEDDFSWGGSSNIDGQYNHAQIHSISYYTDFLDTYTQSSGALRRYSVSTISVLDQACLNQTGYGRIGLRYMQLVDATDGISASVCAPDFSENLAAIAENIIELSTQFYLEREPLVETIQVWVNGVSIPQDAVNGWTYNPDAISIVFHGSAIPPQGAQIIIDYDPLSSL